MTGAPPIRDNEAIDKFLAAAREALVSAPVLPADEPEAECAPMRFENEIDEEGFTVSAKLVPVPPPDGAADLTPSQISIINDMTGAAEPDYETAARALGFQQIPNGKWHHHGRDDDLEHCFTSAQAIFDHYFGKHWLPVQPGAGEREAARILRGWAKAYRDSPEHRFPSDPNAEFFPVDLENAADLLDPHSSREGGQ